MVGPRSYPEGVTSWVDVEQPDVEATMSFYSGLFGWTFQDATPPGVPAKYVVAQLDGRDTAGIGEPRPGDAVDPRWNTYVAVDDAEAAVARVVAAGGRVVRAPADAGECGRAAAVTDPEGVSFRLWQAGRLLGAQAVNVPGGWNFSDLRANDQDAAAAFYTQVFGWAVDDLGFATMIRLPGYGDHLAATSDPDIHARQAGVNAPPGFADAVAWLSAATPRQEPGWHVSFTVENRDVTLASVERLGGTVLDRTDSDWTRDAVIRDPQGAVFTASEFSPPTG